MDVANITADFELNAPEHFDCSFEIYASGTVWGSIDGDINNQTDLINILNGKADISYVDNTITDLAGTVTDNYNTLSGEISTLSTTVNNNYTSLDNRLTTAEQGVLDLTDIINSYGDIVTYSAADFATYNQGVLANTALQPGDNITELNNNAGYITAASLPTVNNNTITIQKNGASVGSFTLNQSTNKSINITVPTNTNELTNGAGFITSADLPTLADLTTTAQLAAINSGATSTNIAQIATNTQAITNEVTNRQNADNDLQTQIDAIVSSSDVFDIVGTYAELQAYDISTVPVNDIIKVLVDSTHNNAATYYRCIENNNVKSWSYIGAEGAYYTKSESDNRFVAKTITVNGQPLSSNVTLTASDVGAATESYVDNGLATKQNTLVSGTNIKTINNETVLGSGNIDIQSSTVAYGTSSTAGNVAEKEVSIPEITELNVGQILYIKPSASATVANLTIKLNNFTAYPIRYNNSAITTSTDDLVWNQNIVSQFIFDGTYWQFAGRGYDNNSTYTQNVLFDRGSFASGSGTYAISRYSLCLQKPDMTWEKVTNTEEDYSVATNKTVNTHGFLLNGEMLYYSNSTVLTNGAVSAANTMYRQNSGFDIRYSMNTTGTGYTAGDYIYLVGTIGVDGLFYLDSTQWWTNTLPTSNDGKIYVKVGKYVSGVTITLELEHPAYYHNGTRICVYQSASNKQDTLVSGTNIKTINNQSLLGSGNITVGGGGGGAVDSVNGQTGVVVLTASDVGALPDSTVIPTVNNATITFTQGGTTKGTITLNQSNNQTIALDAGGSGGGTWGSITGTLSDQTDLQNALNAKLNTSDITEYTAQEVETLWGSI